MPGTASAITTAITFPWSIDPQGDGSLNSEPRRFYERGHSSESKLTKDTIIPPAVTVPVSAQDEFYIDIARDAAFTAKIPETVAEFVATFGLKDKKERRKFHVVATSICQVNRNEKMSG